MPGPSSGDALRTNAAGAVAEEDARATVERVDEAREGLGADDEHVLEVAAGEHRRADDQLVDEPGASGVEVERAAMDAERRRRRRHRCAGSSCSGVAVATTRRSIASGVRPACLIAAAPASIARLAVVSPGAGDATFTDAGALDDPLVGGVDARSRSALVSRCSGRAVPHPAMHGRACSGHAQPGDRLALAETLTGVDEHADQSAAERAADGRRGARAIEEADGLADVDEVALVEIVEGTEHADGRGDDHAFGDEEPFAVGQQSLHGLPDLQLSWGRLRDSRRCRTVTSGAPRLASAASIEPCPTSRNVVAPAADEGVHRRAPAHRDRDVFGEPFPPAVAVVVGDRVVVRHDRAPTAPRT